jgi:hypothetical protein
MRANLRSGSAFLAATLALLPAAAQAQAGTGDPAQNWEAVAACARLERIEQRHACIDGVLRATGLLDAGRELAEQRQRFGEEPDRGEDPVQPPPAELARAAPTPPAAVPPAAAPGAAQPPSAPTPAPPAAAQAPTSIEELETTVLAARFTGGQQLVLMTEEGAIWRQTGSDTLRRLPEAGDPFTVERTLLGGFRCKLRSKFYRCERVD